MDFPNNIKNNKFDITVIGGDKRLSYMIPVLEANNYKVSAYAVQDYSDDKNINSLKEAIQSAKVIVCGIPFSKGNMLSCAALKPDMTTAILIESLCEGQRLFAGVLPDSIIVQCEKKNVIYYDFMKDEPITVYNTIATAEGTIVEAIKNKDTNLHGSNALVLGYGRCAKVLCQKLKGLNAEVSVCCRKTEQQKMAEAFGIKAFSVYNLEKIIDRYDYIFNTIPALIINGSILSKVKKDVLILDIASGQGGVDYEAASQYGINALLCPGLPGIYAPKSSAEVLAEYVIRKAF